MFWIKGIALFAAMSPYHRYQMLFDAVLFDLDYTLFDSEASESEALVKSLEENGIPHSQSTIEDYKAINMSLWKMLEREEIGLDFLRVNRFEQLLNKLGQSKDPQKLADAYTMNLGTCGSFYPGVRDLLEILSENILLGLVTNGVSKTQRLRLEIHDFAKYFDAIVVSGEFGLPKPNPVIFNEALRLLGITSSNNVLMVGDSLSSDMEGARNSGLTSCWLNQTADIDKTTVDVDYHIQSLDQLFDILGISA